MRKIFLVVILAFLSACISEPVMLKRDDTNNQLETFCLNIANNVSNQQNIITNVRAQYKREYYEKIYFKYRLQDFFSPDSGEQCIIKANITAIETELDDLIRSPDFESSDVIKLTVVVNFLNDAGILSTKSFVTEKNSEFTSGVFNTFKKEKNTNSRISKLLSLAYQDIYNQINMDLKRLNQS